MRQTAKIGFKIEMSAGTNGDDWGPIHTFRFWRHAFRWNFRKRAWRAVAGNLRDLPRYLLNKG